MKILKVVFFMINFRTDLALERRDLYRKANNVANEVNRFRNTRGNCRKHN